ncbi:MAG: response regulator [Deltaproteobacteria bacterium]|nr:response regulator [Deltaproteobacteria bacterium]
MATRPWSWRRERPDLITLDLAMPGKSGVDVFEELRRDPELRATPVCIITGRPELRRLIYERVGKTPPEGYLNKPVSSDGLVKTVRMILEVPERKQRKRDPAGA